MHVWGEVGTHVVAGVSMCHNCMLHPCNIGAVTVDCACCMCALAGVGNEVEEVAFGPPRTCR